MDYVFSSYLPTGIEEAPGAYNDGRVGTAMIQEKRFNEYCIRLQRLVASTFDREFKMYPKWRGVEIDNGTFQLRFNEPKTFSSFLKQKWMRLELVHLLV